MEKSKICILVMCTMAILLLTGCLAPSVEIYHSPIIARSNETVTFSARVLNAGSSPADVEILVNNLSVKTCQNLSTGDTCVFTGGPYPAYQGTTISYLAIATDSQNRTDSQGLYHFGITDSNYQYSNPTIPARRTGNSNTKFDLLFHRTDDYPSVSDFVEDVEDKIYAIYGKQNIIESRVNMDDFNFFIYQKKASLPGDCGTVTLHGDIIQDNTWRDADAVLHPNDLPDCAQIGASPPWFTAEGYYSNAFLHESGHGVFDLADEYNAAPNCYTRYFESAQLPNIWDTEAECRQEQTDQNRDPDKCWEFTTCQDEDGDGWWGIQQLTDKTVMQRGLVGDPWGIEGREHVIWWFMQSH